LHGSQQKTRGLTDLISALRMRDPAAQEELAPLLRRQLRRQVTRMCRAGPCDRRDVDVTEVVEQALLGVFEGWSAAVPHRSLLMAAAAPILRQILVRQARAAQTGRWVGGLDIVGLDQALTRLSGLDQRSSRVAEMRLFGGLSSAEVAEALSVPATTARREWRFARTWVYRELSRQDQPLRTPTHPGR
jgi:RNA polymerase sigma-70 factor (ECF subfamily)